MLEKYNSKEFIEKSKLIHNNKYDYSKVKYVNRTTKVCIICPVHGEFLQMPYSHLKGHGCSKCYNILKKLVQKSTKEIFIKKAKLIHGDKYDYFKVDYKNNRTKVCIICSKHGEFLQTPQSHLNKRGCYKCSTIKRSLNQRTTKNQFIKKAKLVHGNKYDYSQVKYINNETKISIICPKHGEFLQIPNSHLNGSGCPKCKSSKGELLLEKILKKYNILYNKQKTFKDCKDKGLLKFDFYLPTHNICIEFDGEQHYKPVHFGNFTKQKSKEIFKNTQRRDKIKNKYCKRKNINLIRIKYNLSPKQIETKITSYTHMIIV